VASDVDTLVETWLTLPEAADLLDVPVTRVRQMIAEHQLIAVRRGESNALMVPGDLIADGKVLKGLPGVLTLLADARYSEDEALVWLYTDDDLPGSPVRALAENRGTEVKRRAQALGF
jgi:excisionase family DNA binding protein